MPPSPHIVVIGGGQSARWLLFALAEQLARSGQGLCGGRVTIIEGQDEFGTGLAWSHRVALEDHLASVPAPLGRCDFGDQQRRQFHGTASFLEEMGLPVILLPRQEAVTLCRAGARLKIDLASGVAMQADYVVIATGYGPPPWRGRALDETIFGGHPGAHYSPWPARAFQEAVFDGGGLISEERPKRVLILGSYLNAIDAALSLALKAGTFRTGRDGFLEYHAQSEFSLVMASRSGQLPRVWAQGPLPSHQARLFCEERLQESLEESERGRFLAIDTALELLSDEVAAAAGDHPSVVARRRRVPIRRRIAAWQRQLAGGRRGERLRSDITAAMANGNRDGRAEAHECGWQSAIDAAIRLWSEYSTAFCAEDQLFFDRELRTTFFNHMLPMTFTNALQLEAMIRAGCLSIVTLGTEYNLQPVPDETYSFTLYFADKQRSAQLLTFTDVVDATGHHPDLLKRPSPLIKSMLTGGIIQPVLRPFRGRRPSNGVVPGLDRHIVRRGEKFYLSGGGIFVNPETREAIPRESVDMGYSGPNTGVVYAMGPNLVGQFADAQSIGQVQYDARKIAADIARKGNVQKATTSQVTIDRIEESSL